MDVGGLSWFSSKPTALPSAIPDFDLTDQQVNSDVASNRSLPIFHLLQSIIEFPVLTKPLESQSDPLTMRACFQKMIKHNKIIKVWLCTISPKLENAFVNPFHKSGSFQLFFPIFFRFCDFFPLLRLFSAYAIVFRFCVFFPLLRLFFATR